MVVDFAVVLTLGSVTLSQAPARQERDRFRYSHIRAVPFEMDQPYAVVLLFAVRTNYVECELDNGR